MRRWFAGEQPLQGHAVGAYFSGGTYDMRYFPKNKNSIGWLSNKSFSAGLSYGYSIELGERWNLEFGLAAGCIWGRRHKYDYHPEENHWEWRSTSSAPYWGITRAGVSVVWLFASGTN